MIPKHYKMMLRMLFITDPWERVEYIRKENIFRHLGDNVLIQNRKLPLYPNLISIGNDVYLASGVTFLTHDVVHAVLNDLHKTKRFKENLGCIRIGNNVFVGANTLICSNVEIGDRVVVGGGSVVTKDLPSDGVYAGSPARYICSFAELEEKRAKIDYKGEIGWSFMVEKELEEELWEKFNKTHDKSLSSGK